jgi:hypothetical protein
MRANTSTHINICYITTSGLIALIVEISWKDHDILDFVTINSEDVAERSLTLFYKFNHGLVCSRPTNSNQDNYLEKFLASSNRIT